MIYIFNFNTPIKIWNRVIANRNRIGRRSFFFLSAKSKVVPVNYKYRAFYMTDLSAACTRFLRFLKWTCKWNIFQKKKLPKKMIFFLLIQFIASNRLVQLKRVVWKICVEFIQLYFGIKCAQFGHTEREIFIIERNHLRVFREKTLRRPISRKANHRIQNEADFRIQRPILHMNWIVASHFVTVN